MKSAYQAIPLGRWCRAWWPSSCATTASTCRSEKRPSSSVSQMKTLRDGPKPGRERVRGPRVVRARPDADRDAPSRPPARRCAAAAAFSCGSSAERCVSGIRYGLSEQEQRSGARRRPQPPGSTSAAAATASPITISTAALSSRKMKAEDEPAAEDHGAVARRRTGRSAAPTRARANSNGSRDEPGEAEAEHREHHPGADRAGRRLAREARAAPRVEREDDDRRDGLAEHEPVEEPLVVLGPVNQARGEELRVRKARQVRGRRARSSSSRGTTRRRPRPRRAQLRLRAALARPHARRSHLRHPR